MSVPPALTGPGATRTPVVLASASEVRARLLRQAGIPVAQMPANVDEEEVKRSLCADGAGPGDVAEALAELKAVSVARRRTGALVIGADQVLDLDGVWFDKPTDREGAREQLLTLKSRTHVLHCCVCVVMNGARIWHYGDSARLTMRAYTDEFIDAYLDAAGERVLDSVGGYQLEGLGGQLFSRIEGDYFTILGLPLLPVLEFLRAHEVVPR